MEVKFVCSSAALSNHLQIISKVIPNKTTIPILDCFLFVLEEDKLTITASDSETTMVTSLKPSSTVGTGTFAISARILLDVLKEFADQPLTFTVNLDTMGIIITSVSGRFSIVGRNPQTYPQIPTIDEQLGTLALTVDELDNGISKTFFSAADDPMRPGMSGIFLDYKSDCLTFVATNAQKLTQLNSYKFKAPEGQEASFILHRKPAAFLRNVLSKEKGEVNIKLDQNNVFFDFENFKMVCRLINSKFPNYEAIIPTQNPNKLTIDRKALIATIRRVSVFASQGTNLIKLQLDDNSMIVSAQDIDFSVSGTETIACDYEGTPMSIGFNSNYLLEILQNIESSDNVVMTLSEPARPGLVAPAEQNDDEKILMLVMPLALNE